MLKCFQQENSRTTVVPYKLPAFTGTWQLSRWIRFHDGDLPLCQGPVPYLETGTELCAGS